MTDDPFGKAARWEKVVGVLGVLVVIYLISDNSDTLNEQLVRGWYRVALLGIVLAIPALIVYAIWKQEGLARAGWLLAPVIAAAGLLTYYGIFGHDDREHSFIADYCHYGAVSQAQLKGCLDHATYKQIEQLDTNAAQFAARELDDCLDDAGPYCEATLNWNLLQDQAPPPGQ